MAKRSYLRNEDARPSLLSGTMLLDGTPDAELSAQDYAAINRAFAERARQMQLDQEEALKLGLPQSPNYWRNRPGPEIPIETIDAYERFFNTGRRAF